MDTPESRSQRARMREIIEVCKLLEMTDAPELRHEQVNRLVALYGQQESDCEDHVLRIAGRLCMEYGQTELWEQIYREAREGGCQVDLGDEMVFLDASPKPDPTGGKQPG
jgi:hypothetical protein